MEVSSFYLLINFLFIFVILLDTKIMEYATVYKKGILYGLKEDFASYVGDSKFYTSSMFSRFYGKTFWSSKESTMPNTYWQSPIIPFPKS